MTKNQKLVLKIVEQRLNDPDFLDIFDYHNWDDLVEIEDVPFEDIEWIRDNYTVKMTLIPNKNNE